MSSVNYSQRFSVTGLPNGKIFQTFMNLGAAKSTGHDIKYGIQIGGGLHQGDPSSLRYGQNGGGFGSINVISAGGNECDERIVFNKAGVTLPGLAMFLNDISLNGNLFVGKDVRFNSNLYVTNKGTFLDDISLNGNLFVGKDVSFNSNLYVGELITLKVNPAGQTDNRLQTKIKFSEYCSIDCYRATMDNGSSESIRYNAKAGHQFYANTDGPGTADKFMSINQSVGVEIEKDLKLIGNLNANGSVTASSFNATSDYRLKENIEKLNNTYSVENLNPVSYVLKTNKEPHLGFLAHELQEYFPTAVSGVKDGETVQTVNYMELIPVLVKEIQNLKKEVTLLKKDIEYLKQV